MVGQMEDKVRTWQLMIHIKRDNKEGWLSVGDFNETLWSFEKIGGNPKSWRSMETFREAMRFCSLEDLGYTGSMFTWSNGRQGNDNIRERLDQFLASLECRNTHLSYKIRHLPRYKSNHSPILLESGLLNDGIERRGDRHGFRFEHMWIEHPAFVRTLKESWSATTLMNNLSGQLNQCGADLVQWARKEFGSVRKKKKRFN